MLSSSTKKEPAHYMLKIESFSILSEAGSEKVESDNFEASGHKWGLDFYPNGDGEENVDDHISLYLILCDSTENRPKGWEVHVDVKFFVYDHIHHHYVTFQDVDGNRARFHDNQMKWGFAKLIPLVHFKDNSRGYLFNDSCVFGVEVFQVPKYTQKDRCLSFTKPPATMNTYTWTVDKFSALTENRLCSEVFKVGKVKWGDLMQRIRQGIRGLVRCSVRLLIRVYSSRKFFVLFSLELHLSSNKKANTAANKAPNPLFNPLHKAVNSSITTTVMTSQIALCPTPLNNGSIRTLLIFPKGTGSGAGKDLSIFLAVHEDASLPDGWRVYAKYELRVKNQSGQADRVKETKFWFCESAADWGFKTFMPLSELRDTTKGFLLKDRLIVEAKISVTGVIKDFM